MKKIYCIPKPGELEQYLAFSSMYDAAFEYNDFYLPKILDDRICIERIIKIYQDTGRDLSQDTMHGAFLDICINSNDPLIWKASDYRVRQCMEIASRLGLHAVIYHTNYIINFKLRSYEQEWINRNEEYWNRLLEEYPDINIYMENMFDDSPKLLAELAGRLQSHPRFGVCLDTAHAGISGTPADEWYKVIGPFTRHLHINDNNGQEDLHQPVGSGICDWQKFSCWCKSLNKPLSVLIEVRSFKDLTDSIDFMQTNHIYPFENVQVLRCPPNGTS